jgi:hypothetical protein
VVALTYRATVAAHLRSQVNVTNEDFDSKPKDGSFSCETELKWLLEMCSI